MEMVGSKPGTVDSKILQQRSNPLLDLKLTVVIVDWISDMVAGRRRGRISIRAEPISA
jgi:hypothetical protein